MTLVDYSIDVAQRYRVTQVGLLYIPTAISLFIIVDMWVNVAQPTSLWLCMVWVFCHLAYISIMKRILYYRPNWTRVEQIDHTRCYVTWSEPVHVNQQQKEVEQPHQLKILVDVKAITTFPLALRLTLHCSDVNCRRLLAYSIHCPKVFHVWLFQSIGPSELNAALRRWQQLF